jgi:hypothetical protein
VLQAGGLWVRLSVGFLIDLILLFCYDPGFDSDSNRHEFSGLSAGVVASA